MPIEHLMLVTLGAAIACVGWIAFWPVFSARAERLARRRVELALPTSLAELLAERDHLRAELAVDARRIEKKAEAAAIERARDMEELGRRAVRIKALEDDVATGIARADGLTRELEAARSDLAATRASFEETVRQRDALRATLEGREAELASLGAAHRTLEGRYDALRVQHAALVTAQENARATIAELSAGATARDARIAALTRDLMEREAARAELETRLAMAERRLAETAETLSSTKSRLEAATADAAHAAEQAARDIAALTTQRDALREEARGRMAELEASAAARAALEADLAATRDALTAAQTLAQESRAEARTLEGALASARADRERLQASQASAPRDADASADRAALLARIEDLADAILRMDRAPARPPRERRARAS